MTQTECRTELHLSPFSPRSLDLQEGDPLDMITAYLYVRAALFPMFDIKEATRSLLEIDDSGPMGESS